MFYLLTVTLTFLSSANWIECRYEVHRTISKIFTTGNWRLMYCQRIRILKYRVPLRDESGRLNLGKTIYFKSRTSETLKTVWVLFVQRKINAYKIRLWMNEHIMKLYFSSSTLFRFCRSLNRTWSLYCS